MKIVQRPVVVFLHTDWCKYCQAMKQTTWKNKEVLDALEDYYFISFDGESKDPVEFLGKTFKYRPTGKKTGIHDIATQLGSIDGQVNYPTTVILSPNYEILFQHNAYLPAKDMLTFLRKFK
ncbi:MAG: thioredoxin family protein [Cyclobacteriaceae bacterium]